MMRLFRRRPRQDDYRRAAPRLIPLQPQRAPRDRLGGAMALLSLVSVLWFLRGCAPALLPWVFH